MNPRLPSSKKWTSLPKELLAQIKDVFTENFSQYTKNGKIIIDGRIYPKELLFRVGYLENGRIRQANFEVSMDFDPNKQNALAQIHFAVDCAASLLQEFFDAALDLDSFPKTWNTLEVEKEKAYFQVTTINTDLEREADRLLGLTEENLVQGEDELDIIDELEVDDLDNEDPSVVGTESTIANNPNPKKTLH